MVRIAFATETPDGIRGEIAQHFGRCPYYTFVDVEEGEVKDWLVVTNPAAQEHNPGEIPRFIAEQGATAIVSGGMGPRAQEWFLRLGIKPFVGVKGKIKDALPLILKGELEPIEKPRRECGEDSNDDEHGCQQREES